MAKSRRRSSDSFLRRDSDLEPQYILTILFENRRKKLLLPSTSLYCRSITQVRLFARRYLLRPLILASTENQEISDYLQERDIGFRKPKKKKKHATRKVEESDITLGAGIEDEMDVDRPAAPSRNLNTNFVDDDELQAALARSRKAKMKQVPKLSPEEIARRGT